MGCRVNGPGETDDADLGLWCGPNFVNLKKGERSLGAYPYDEILGRLRSRAGRAHRRENRDHRLSSFRGDIGPPPLSGTHRIAAWAPGTEIRFEKPRSFAFFVHLPLTLMVFAGPAMWISMGRRQQPDLTGQVGVSVVVGLIGLWLGLSNLSAARRAPPSPSRFTGRRGCFASRAGAVEIPLAAITAIEVRGVSKADFARPRVRHGNNDLHYKVSSGLSTGPPGRRRQIELVENEFVARIPRPDARSVDGGFGAGGRSRCGTPRDGLSAR